MIANHARKSVTLSDLHTVTPRQGVADQDDTHGEGGTGSRAAAEALIAQRWVRVGVAVAGAVVQSAIILTLPGRGNVRDVLVATALYLVFIALTVLLVRRRGSAPPAIVTAALAGDLTYVFVATMVSTSPAHYERALLGAMVVVHAANFYFGRRQAGRVLGMGALAYVVLILSASHRQLPVDRVEELWTLGIGVLGTMLIVSQAGHVRRRLRTIVTLFERAEHGDFTHTYDEVADQRNDAITRVGQTYNRVRMQLASMVLSDPLTGCLNRRGFEQALAREIARASRAGTELALLVLDLDHFKQVNDTWGHPAGDEVLRATGRLLQQAARVGDIVARVGGEEFAILLPATGAEGGMIFASRLCELVRAHPVPIASDRPSIRVTTSIGVAAVAPRNSRESGGEAGVLARHADMALYAAKRDGRDNARQWSQQLETLPRSSGAKGVDDSILGLA